MDEDIYQQAQDARFATESDALKTQQLNDRYAQQVNNSYLLVGAAALLGVYVYKNCF